LEMTRPAFIINEEFNPVQRMQTEPIIAKRPATPSEVILPACVKYRKTPQEKEKRRKKRPASKTNGDLSPAKKVKTEAILLPPSPSRSFTNEMLRHEDEIDDFQLKKEEKVEFETGREKV
jgi:hypothetical protein